MRAATDDDIDTWLQEATLARAAGQLAAGLELSERAWAAVSEDDPHRRRRAGLLVTHFRYRTGELKTAIEAAHAVLPLLRASGPTSELIDTLRLIAIAGSDTGDFPTALACAQEAQQLADEIGDLPRLSLAINALGCFFERMGDPWQGERLLLEAVDLAESADDAYARFAALNNLTGILIGKFYLLRDGVPLAEAREPLETALPYARRAMQHAREQPDPFLTVFVQGNLGEITAHLGLFDEARAALGESLAVATAGGYTAQIWRIECSLGELHIGEGRAEEAWTMLRRVLGDVADSEIRTTHMRLHHALWRSARDTHRHAEASHHLERYMQLERARSVNQLRAQSSLFVSRMEAEQARREVHRQRTRASALEADSRRDQLTGLGNRRELEQRLPELLLHMDVTGGPLALAMLDLDHFKRINDRFGHAIGDDVLVALAQILRENTRIADLAARIGGEEFLLVLPDAPPVRAMEVCERIRRRVAEHDWSRIAHGLHVTLSIGVAHAPPLDAETLSLRADAALYRAKDLGRNQVVQA